MEGCLAVKFLPVVAKKGEGRVTRARTLSIVGPGMGGGSQRVGLTANWNRGEGELLAGSSVLV